MASFNNEEKILKFFGDLFKDSHEKIDHAVDMKVQDLLMNVTSKADNKVESLKKDLSSYVEELKAELKIAKETLQLDLIAQCLAQTKRNKLWFWNK